MCAGLRAGRHRSRIQPGSRSRTFTVSPAQAASGLGRVREDLLATGNLRGTWHSGSAAQTVPQAAAHGWTGWVWRQGSCLGRSRMPSTGTGCSGHGVLQAERPVDELPGQSLGRARGWLVLERPSSPQPLNGSSQSQHTECCLVGEGEASRGAMNLPAVSSSMCEFLFII